MARGVNNTGRNRKDSRHVRLYEHVLNSDAYRALGVYSRALLVEFYRRYNGGNNSKIHMSYREAAELCNCSQKPIRVAFDELQKTGFISIAKKGAFSVKIRHATEWTLAEYSVGKAPASKEFMRWQDSKTDPLKKKSRRTLSTDTAYSKLKVVNKTDEKHADGVPIGYREGNIDSSHGVPRGYTYNLPCTHSEAQASSPSKGQAQPSDVQGNMVGSKKNNPQSDVIRAAGGFCKIIQLKKNSFEKSDFQSCSFKTGARA